MSKTKDLYLEELMREREEYLSLRGYKDGDVMCDEIGEYIMTFSESEGVYGPMRKQYLPKNIQI